eukprot:TRINITY_DN95560_c0_g1_i1.p2 TRINITY_DN95560_c0_g1~~TRINITY_DN95560_c0_g1_i1.p2  ORF type:complete len:132 (+),score=21.02 TRINITY_DN95560_c0_g1_i1:669-1064(+)
MSIGTISFLETDHKAALDYFRRALAAFEHGTGSELERARCLTWLGTTHLEIRETSYAAEHFEKALEILAQLGAGATPESARCIMGKGKCLLQQGKDGATQAFRMALDIFESESLGMGGTDEAEYCRRALEG